MATSKPLATTPANPPKEVGATIPAAAPLDVDADADAVVVEAVEAVEAMEAVVELLPPLSLRVTWPKLIPKCSHQRPTVLKSAVVFPASSLIVMSVGFVVAIVIWSFEMRNPSFSTPSVVPHQYRAGAEAS